MKASVTAIEYYLPERVLSNDELAVEFQDWDAGKIYEKTGIASRHIAAVDEFASDMAVQAVRRLLDSTGARPETIEYLLLCTQSPDYHLPTTACLVQERVGLPTSCGALDISLGCSGYVYGLSLAKGLIESGQSRNVVLVTTETYSKHIHPQDRSVRTLFGDAATATLLTAVENEDELIGPFVLGTDGAGANNLIVPAGGMRLQRSAETAVEYRDGSSIRSKDNLYMNGPEIFNFTIRAVPRLCTDLLAKAGLGAETIDLFCFHQANRFMLEHLRKKIGIPEDKFLIDVEEVGNTVSSTIPLTLKRACQSGMVHSGMRVMLLGFGVGYSWAAAMIRISDKNL